MDSPKKDQPVAYDENGRPLYHHPPTNSPSTAEPQIVQITKPSKAIPIEIPEDIKNRHKDSKQKYPFLNLSDGEYVVSAVRRHPIGLISIWLVASAAILSVLLSWMLVIAADLAESKNLLASTSIASGSLFVIGIVVLVVLFAVVATLVYRNNKFFLTNESVISYSWSMRYMGSN